MRATASLNAKRKAATAERSVGVNVIREMAGVTVREKAAAAIIVTVGRFTAEAIKDAARLPVRLIDGAELLRMKSQKTLGAGQK